MVKVTVDGHEVEVANGATVLQACEQAGKEIPRFCYHERLSIAGNCRMCLVEVERSPKPVASCAMPVNEGMVIKTDTPLVKKAREGVMEFLLINHPLDCPICDQGGECDLQDQAMAYGRGKSRYTEHKRAVEEKDMGPLVKTQMTRCIHCTRCVRFAQDIAGVPELGAFGRGEHMEITTYLNQSLQSELSGNVVDLCPVGALTSRPYAYRARPWELRPVETIDVMDAVGSHIRVDARGQEVMRVLPRLSEEINEEWISDKTRHACDGLRVQRLDRPYVRRDGKLRPASWQEALDAIAERLRGVHSDRVAAIAGDLVDAEALYALRKLLESMGVTHMDCRQDGAWLSAESATHYRFNTTIAGIEDADACLLIGVNPRVEAAIIQARLRKRYLRGGFRVAAVGEPMDLTYPVSWLGNDASLLEAGNRAAIEAFFAGSKRPMLILGQAALRRPDAEAILHAAGSIAEACGLVQDGWNGFNVLQLAAARAGGMAVGFLPGKRGRKLEEILDAASSGTVEVVYLLGADELDMSRLGQSFVIYQGHHGDAAAARADVVLPGAAYTEKDGLYMNTEGRVQQAHQVVPPPGEAREDWKIIRALSAALHHPLPFDSLAELRQALAEEKPAFSLLGCIAPAVWSLPGVKGNIAKTGFLPAISNFYMTDPISRASRTMAECTQMRLLDERKAA